MRLRLSTLFCFEIFTSFIGSSIKIFLLRITDDDNTDFGRVRICWDLQSYAAFTQGKRPVFPSTNCTQRLGYLRIASLGILTYWVVARLLLRDNSGEFTAPSEKTANINCWIMVVDMMTRKTVWRGYLQLEIKSVSCTAAVTCADHARDTVACNRVKVRQLQTEGNKI